MLSAVCLCPVFNVLSFFKLVSLCLTICMNPVWWECHVSVLRADSLHCSQWLVCFRWKSLYTTQVSTNACMFLCVWHKQSRILSFFSPSRPPHGSGFVRPSSTQRSPHLDPWKRPQEPHHRWVGTHQPGSWQCYFLKNGLNWAYWGDCVSKSSLVSFRSDSEWMLNSKSYYWRIWVNYNPCGYWNLYLWKRL